MIDIIAQSIDKIHIKFECPFCYNKYKKDGTPYKRAKRLIHKHGSGGNLKNRVEHRGAHCDYERNNKSFNIHITDKTIRK